MRIVLSVFFSIALPGLVSAQSGSICATLESNIDSQLRTIAMANAMTTADDSAIRLNNYHTEQGKGWLTIRTMMDQMRDNKCRPLPYSLGSEPYGLPAAQCGYAIAAKQTPLERMELCDKSKWKRG